MTDEISNALEHHQWVADVEIAGKSENPWVIESRGTLPQVMSAIVKAIVLHPEQQFSVLLTRSKKDTETLTQGGK